MQSTPTIRRARLQDAAEITALVNDAYAPYIARIGKKPAPMLDDYQQVISDASVFVVQANEQIAGVLVVQAQHRVLLLNNIAVAPGYKGQGIGKRLMMFCEDYAQRQGCAAIELYTHELMTENIAIYKKLGYVETHRATENGYARVFMRKTLPH
ncbi:GNAT family N-acetyltransferase [Pseudomonas sp. H9]|uniref:GNAT family N-acetyltransferase n=1 Tax=Pseudomonas sp. H9 TaxID=483968 RepID=UPI0010583411|nr:GNAT family N-acetyltransferase [Pseudomonas sp. H9]TDF82658.1 GNAT family N-acetyltransferase [Pseudomonas sp. H9]